MTRKIRLAAISWAMLCAHSVSASAQSPSPPEAATSAKAHDHRGFLVRLSMGPVYGTTSTGDSAAGRFEIKGSGVGFNMGLGYSILPNLALTVDFFGPVLVDPTLKDPGSSSTVATQNVSADWFTYGLGVTYYVMPLNAYFGGSIGLSALTFELTRGGVTTSTTSGNGVAAQLLAGKEWWVSDEWGLGASLQLTLARIPDSDLVWKAGSLALLFSATYN